MKLSSKLHANDYLIVHVNIDRRILPKPNQTHALHLTANKMCPKLVHESGIYELEPN